MLISQSVYEEAVVKGMRKGCEDALIFRRFLQQEGWGPTAVGSIPEAVASLHLDTGERESIALALEKGALLLIDEERGRMEARRLGLKVRGTLGVLIQAYRSGIITSDQLRFYFGEIQEKTDIWISPALCQRLLQEVLG